MKQEFVRRDAVELQLVRANYGTRGVDRTKHQCVNFGTRDRHTQNLTTSMVGRLVTPPNERRHHLLPVVPPLAHDDDAIELLPLGLVHGHDLHTRRIVDAAKNLILRERNIQAYPVGTLGRYL